jgi:hypothetical protein
LVLVEALGDAVAHLSKAGVEGSIPFVSTALTSEDALMTLAEVPQRY